MAEYEEYLEFAYGLAEKATKLIVQGSAERWKIPTSGSEEVEVDTKKNSVDLVTATDQAVEEMIKSSIASVYPSHSFIGEESFAAGERQEVDDGWVWIVDPIDGTMNFVHSHPSVGCSIGLMHNRQPVVGVIALPFLNQIFSARQGGGAFLNRTIPLPLTGGIPQPLTRLRDCMIGAEWGSDRSDRCLQPRLNSFRRLAGNPEQGVEGGQMIHAFRSTGSSVCNMMAVAAGHIDIYWDAGCWAWDVCAGSVILREAGGFFTGSKAAFESQADIADIILGRKYVGVRAIPKNKNESGQDIQKRLVRELYDVVEELQIGLQS